MQISKVQTTLQNGLSVPNRVELLYTPDLAFSFLDNVLQRNSYTCLLGDTYKTVCDSIVHNSKKNNNNNGGTGDNPNYTSRIDYWILVQCISTMDYYTAVKMGGPRYTCEQKDES